MNDDLKTDALNRIRAVLDKIKEKVSVEHLVEIERQLRDEERRQQEVQGGA